jgi:hypothetical protein
VIRPTILLGFSAAVSVGLLVWLAAAFPAMGLLPWISLISAGAYFTAGAGVPGLLKPAAAGTLGIVCTAAAIKIAGVVGAGQVGFALIVSRLAFAIVAFSLVPIFSHVPSAFMAASCYVGANGAWDMSIVLIIFSWCVGLGLAWMIDRLSQILVTASTGVVKGAGN